VFFFFLQLEGIYSGDMIGPNSSEIGAVVYGEPHSTLLVSPQAAASLVK